MFFSQFKSIDRNIRRKSSSPKRLLVTKPAERKHLDRSIDEEKKKAERKKKRKAEKREKKVRKIQKVAIKIGLKTDVVKDVDDFEEANQEAKKVHKESKEDKPISGPL